jgi:YYY domain-containing protein
LHKRGLLPAGFWRWLDIRDLKIPPTASDSWIPDRFIWWWRGSRVLTDYTLTGNEQEVIDEFPFFSFLLGDVHPHVLALPFVLLVVALALNLLANRSTPAGEGPAAKADNLVDKTLQLWQESWQGLLTLTGGRPGFVGYAVALGALSFLNTWDFPIYLSVVGLALIARLAQSSLARTKKEDADSQSSSSFLLPGVVGAVLLGVTGIILYLPFYATFQSQARGILPNLWNPTRLPQFFVFFGTFLVATIFLLVVLSRHSRGWREHLGWSLSLTVLGPVLLMLAVLSGVLLSPSGREYVGGILNNPEVQQLLGQTSIGALVQESLTRRLINPWTFLLLGGLLGWTLALMAGQLTTAGSSVPTRFVLILLLVGLGLPLSVEFIYLRDNFGTRMNTIFKFYFQAWVLLALASAYAVYYVTRHLRGLPALVWQVSMVLLVAASMIYPILAIADKTNYFNNEPTLNGIRWIADFRPGDYAAIQWLRQNAPDGAVILEAPGAQYAAYQYTGRVSALTGLPTLLGWGGHQSQWRGNYEVPARREPDINTLFNTSDLQKTRELLDKYDITYVYVGPLERERYSPQGLNKFARLMEVVYQQDGVTIYQRR